MKAEQLRKSILQMAIQGKLVPQDPNDEPAAVLLEKIRAEKQRLIKEGKIKKDKAESVIFRGEDNRHYEKVGNEVQDITDEIDFELPNGWGLARIGSLFYIQTGASFKKEQATNDKTKIRILRGGNIIQNGYSFFDNDIFIDHDLVSDNILLRQNDIITPAVTSIENIGKLALIERDYDNVSAGGFVFICRPHLIIGAFAKFLLFALQSHYFNSQMKSITKKSGQAFYNLGKERLVQLLVPIPPLSEQQRIVAEIEKYEPLIAEYDKLEQQKTKLDSEIYDKLKKSILQYAIQGKLVPQDENDEPASELLKRIRAEKKAKLGKKYVDSYIYKGDDNCYYEHIAGITNDEAVEVPFNLPNNWAWCRLDNLALYKKGPFGSSLTKDMFVPKSDSNIKVYEQKNAIYKDCTLGNYYISEQKYNTMKSFEVFANDIIVSCAGTIGETYILPNNCPKGIINQALMKITLFKQEIVEFYLLYFDYILKIQAQQSSKGSAIKNIPPFEILKNMLMPLPPLAEQQRIVDKINEIFAKL